MMISTFETIDHRVLGAIRLIDITTGLPIRAPLRVEAAGLDLRRNRRGDFVIWRAAGLETHSQAFDAPPAAPPGGALTFDLSITDPAGNYLPRRSALALPRSADPDAPDSFFTPALIALFPAPAAHTESSWAVIRGTVRQSGTRARLPWALIRVLHATKDTILASGLADARGEALVAVPGILITMPADDGGPVLTTELAVKLTVSFDGARLRKLSDEDLAAGAQDPNLNFVPDPDALGALASHAAQIQASGEPALSATGKLAAGRTLVANVLATLS